MPRLSPSSPACRPRPTPERKCAPSSPLSSLLHRAALFSLASVLMTVYSLEEGHSLTASGRELDPVRERGCWQLCSGGTAGTQQVQKSQPTSENSSAAHSIGSTQSTPCSSSSTA
ncbi:hypothetical protein INR49_008430 [Caranx melampygus]|nr:hypothetical protein INR49_008430 [Caranx melampygus]